MQLIWLSNEILMKFSKWISANTAVAFQSNRMQILQINYLLTRLCRVVVIAVCMNDYSKSASDGRVLSSDMLPLVDTLISWITFGAQKSLKYLYQVILLVAGQNQHHFRISSLIWKFQTPNGPLRNSFSCCRLPANKNLQFFKASGCNLKRNI